MIPKAKLQELYVRKGLSMQQVAVKLKCSVNTVVYWMDSHGIQRRSMSDAIYNWHNPNGDPFYFKYPKNVKEAYLFGMGLGLYWGEGTKANKNSMRLANSDPELLLMFISFLEKTFEIDPRDLRFCLQIFSDLNKQEVLNFWTKKLKMNKNQFGKVIVTISGSIGTYRNKSEHGVVTIYYHNKKLRDLLVSLLPR